MCVKIGLDCKIQQLYVFIDVRNTQDCYIKFEYVRTSLTYEKYLYKILDELAPILYGVKFTKCEIYGSTKLIERNQHHIINFTLKKALTK